MKILGLDLGDVWTGVAITDALAMLARPYETIKTNDLYSFLSDLFAKEKISTIVIGHPQTLRGTKSAQTEKVERVKEKYEKQFPDKEWILWDERYTSQYAQDLKPPKSKQDKIKSHAVAASFILTSYLEYKRLQDRAL